jgi:hypothetical protein
MKKWLMVTLVTLGVAVPAVAFAANAAGLTGDDCCPWCCPDT